MKMINENLDNSQFIDMPYPFYFKDMNVGVFDIETTGLSPDKCHLVLSGFLLPQDENVYCRQIFAESLGDEASVIEETIKVLSALDMVITYNGAAFDIPFLLRRAKFHNITIERLPYNLDLYKVVRNHSEIRKFTPNLKQKTLENYMGLWQDRSDTISGKESVELYYYYLESGDVCAQEKILLHNRDDVVQLHRLLGVLRQTDFHQAMCSMGFPINKGVIENIRLNSRRLKVSGVLYDLTDKYKSYDDELGYTTDFHNGQFEINVELINEQGLLFIDLNKLNAPFEYFSNCGSLFKHYLILSEDKSVKHSAVTTISKYLTERIIKDELC